MKKNSVHSLYLNLSKASSGRKFFIAFLAGLLSIFALPPIHFFLVLFLTIPTLIWLLDNIDDSRISFFVGWFFGLGYFLGGLYWIAYSFFVDADQFAWLAPFAILALISLLSIFIGLVTLVFSKFNVFGSGRALIFSSVWVIMEWLRGHIFTGLPWNLIGSSLTFSDELIQVSSIFGAWGLSFFAVLSFSFLGCVRPKFLFKNPSYTTIPFLILIILWCGGHARLFFAEENFFPNIRINIIQANIQQEDKWIPENREKIFFKHLEITRDSFKGRVEGEDLELFIWPETCLLYTSPSPRDQRGSRMPSSA